MITPASNVFRRLSGRRADLRIHPTRWDALFAELAARGEGWKESGAFLLTPKAGDRRTVSEIVYFDELDPDALTGAIHLRSLAFSRLWRICRERELAVLADVHTHPGAWVGQSGTDKDNPMIARAGHYAIIVPDLARGSRDPRHAGFHIYRGDAGWEAHLGEASARHLYVGRWA